MDNPVWCASPCRYPRAKRGSDGGTALGVEEDRLIAMGSVDSVFNLMGVSGRRNNGKPWQTYQQSEPFMPQDQVHNTLTRRYSSSLHCGAILFIGVCIVMFASQVEGAGNTNESSILISGPATNGLCGEIDVVSHAALGRPVELLILVRQLDWTNGRADKGDSLEALLDKMRKQDNTDYLMATNAFCGPIELLDSRGQRLSPLKPEVSSMSSYPSSYSQQAANLNYFRRYQIYSGPGVFPLPLMLSSPRDELVRFQICRAIKAGTPRPYGGLYDRIFPLTDYFDIKEPGQYTFTVWPKIYKRSNTNNDTYNRMDLPPVSAVIDWNGVTNN